MGSKLIHTSPNAALTSPLYLSLSHVANILFSTLISSVFSLCSSLQSTDQGTCIKTSGKIVVIWSKNFRAASSVVFTAVWSTIRVFWDVTLLQCVGGFWSFQRRCRILLQGLKHSLRVKSYKAFLIKVLCEDEDRLFVCPSVCLALCLSPNIGDETNWSIFVHSVYEFFTKKFSTLVCALASDSHIYLVDVN